LAEATQENVDPVRDSIEEHRSRDAEEKAPEKAKEGAPGG
jgi:hypothetical protein